MGPFNRHGTFLSSWDLFIVTDPRVQFPAEANQVLLSLRSQQIGSDFGCERLNWSEKKPDELLRADEVIFIFAVLLSGF
ncbi:hypothetical protein PRIPAC_74524 [Pristionchus pacificus]|uniref:Uncharacterized protein n=1 Tax=Pristionchus pacificus TaxID=54126 RepID=A0A2A6C0D1_PRIPA|nr:hypothetical protein PRIPAC_74524 [Pristionchus pacificus]|eukprot:PDM71635.1 hypothetical protein PRIPAC_38042 [Pristionchus pacificus]